MNKLGVRTLAIIAARGGSKGIPKKNLVQVCGKPLLAWSVMQACEAQSITDVVVSSDDQEILAVAKSYGAHTLERPAAIASDTATSEAAWCHALDFCERQFGAYDRLVLMQATSPIREASDIEGALSIYDHGHFDSVLSVCEVEDYFTWGLLDDGSADAINYDWRDRRRRQEIQSRYLENGSLYVTSPKLLRNDMNRLGGRIGLYLMERHKMFQIDQPEDIGLCEAIMRGFGYA